MSKVSKCCKVNESRFGTCANCGLPFKGIEREPFTPLEAKEECKCVYKFDCEIHDICGGAECKGCGEHLDSPETICENCDEELVKDFPTPQLEKGWEEEMFKYSHEKYIGSSSDLYINTTRAIKICSQALADNRRKVVEELKPKIGMLRQWLNEDRITDVNKMVDNEQIEKWLGLQDLKNK